MKNKDKFDINKFASPDVSYAPVYVWVWNDICTREIIDEQLAEMQRLGIRAFYILPEPRNFRPDSMPTNLFPDYLSAEYFELCTYVVQRGRELGMRCWLYDEGGWPSGGACGEVLKAHPEYAREVLETSEHSFSAGEAYKKSTPDVLAAFIDDKSLIEEGYVFSSDTFVTEYLAEKHIYGNADYPDLLNKAATEYFIDITHEKYAASMRDELGKSVTAVFTDEPKAPFRPFNYKLVEEYEKLYGESIFPHLPLICQRAVPTEENVHILHRWYDLCSRMFCDNFMLPCKKWANDHGLAFTGHLDKDHDPLGCVRGSGNFNMMRALRCFDIPGIDVIWRQIYPQTEKENQNQNQNDMNCYNGFFPRYASSAAAQNGSKFAMAEIFGVAGAAMTYDVMRYTVGYLAVRGINIFNPFNFPLGRKGVLLAQELPVFTENQPYYQFLAEFNRYVERLSYVCSLGKRVCQTGLYYPVCDFQGGLNAEAAAKEFDNIGRALEDINADFDVVDDDVIQVSKLSADGIMRIGNAEYQHIIIPRNVFVPQDTQRVLKRFSEGGGTFSHELTELTSVIRADGEGLRAMHRKCESAEIFFLFRECGESGEYKIYLPSSSGYLLDLVTGDIRHFEAENGTLSLSLAFGETKVILLTDDVPEAEKNEEFINKTDISGEFMFSKELELVCNENGFENIKHHDEAAAVALGDWSYLNGEGYSGSGAYETVFTLPEEKVGREGVIDLGDVRFSARVYINDRDLGTAFVCPYRVKIPAGILEKSNKLKVVVTNTSANWYLNTDYFDKWNVQELSPYFEAELDYASDIVSGGLYGPVVLYT